MPRPSASTSAAPRAVTPRTDGRTPPPRLVTEPKPPRPAKSKGRAQPKVDYAVKLINACFPDLDDIKDMSPHQLRQELEVYREKHTHEFPGSVPAWATLLAAKKRLGFLN